MLHEAFEKRQNKSDLTRALSFYNENKNADDDYLARLNDQQRSFFRNYKILLQNVERAKISVCRSIANWDLNADLTKVGTYPIPVPINPFEQEGEGLLTLAAYVAYADFCAHSQSSSSHLKGLPHRSAGPLWALLRNLIKNESRSLRLSTPLRDLFEGPNYNQFNLWIDEIAKSKHGKEFNIDFVSLLGHLGNSVGKIFSDCLFGVFESVTPKRFASGKFQGIFRNLSGASQTFINVLEYEGSQPFSDSDVFVVNPKAGTALNLSPLFLWGLNRHTVDEEPALC